MTAHLYWDRTWRTPDGRADWSHPDPWIAGSVGELRRRGVRDVLDLGCGVGRHTIFLAAEGFSCSGIDLSPAAISYATEVAEKAGVTVGFSVGAVTDLPYPAACFDFVFAFNVVYHTDEPGLRQALAEVKRVLRPGGIYQCTMLSKRNREYGRGVEVSPNTFCQPTAVDDKVHPHLYTDAADLVRLHDGLQLISAADEEHSAPGSFHWHCRFALPAAARPQTPR